MLTRYHRYVSRFTVCSLLALTAGCTPTMYPSQPPPSQPETSPTIELPARPQAPSSASSEPVEIKQGPAAALYWEAETALKAAHPARAEMLIERALHIEPRNPYYWHILAQSAFSQGRYDQAVQFCLKADSLAGNDSSFLERNRSLLNRAKALSTAR